MNLGNLPGRVSAIRPKAAIRQIWAKMSAIDPKRTFAVPLENGLDADRLNRWLTLGANAGVLFGIALLLIELDQNSDLLRAQVHQARTDAHVSQRLNDVESDILTSIRMKLEENGYPQDVNSAEALTPEELFRFKDYMAARYTDLDNLFYQYQRGYLDEEYYRYRVVCSIRRNAPYWQKFGTFRTNSRPTFSAEIERIMRDVEWC